MSKKVIEVVTKKLIEALDEGKIPWVQPWRSCRAYNADTGHVYTGSNAILLSLNEQGPAFLGLKAIKRLGGTIRPGFKEEIVLFASNVNGKKKVVNGEEKRDRYFMMRYYKVIPVSFIDGLPQRIYDKVAEKQAAHGAGVHADAEHILTASGADIRYGGDRAFSRCSDTEDFIGLPPRESFDGTDHFYATALHELTHWTRHADRLDRPHTKYGRDEEELIAEIAGTALCFAVGIDTEEMMENAKGYCQGWAEKLRRNPHSITKCASQAGKAAEYLLDLAGYGEMKEAA